MRLADFRHRGVFSGYPDQNRCIFIHIPKAAGTSVTRTLFRADSRHLNYMDYQRANPRKFKKYFKFTFVRNPWDRLFSAYSFLARGGMNDLDHAWAGKNLSNYPDFESFVHGWVNEKNIWSWVHFKPQHWWLCDGRHRIQVDFVGRFEQMDKDVSFVQQRLGLPIQPLPKINVTEKAKHATNHYTPETQQIVAQVYQTDIKLFGYSETDCLY